MCGDFFLSLPANKEDAVGDDVRSETFCSASQRETEEERGEKVTVATRELLASTPELKLSVENEKKNKNNLFLGLKDLKSFHCHFFAVSFSLSGIVTKD